MHVQNSFVAEQLYIRVAFVLKLLDIKSYVFVVDAFSCVNVDRRLHRRSLQWPFDALVLRPILTVLREVNLDIVYIID